MWLVFANAKATHNFSAKILVLIAIFNDQGFKNTLTNDIVCFEQLGPGKYFSYCFHGHGEIRKQINTICLKKKKRLI